MANIEQRHQPPGQTSDSPQRPAQRLSGMALRFDLQEELDRLRREESWLRGDRNAKTLVKEPHLHVTLAILKSGARLDEHETEGPLTIHTLEGRVTVSALGERIDLSRGQIAALDAGVPHWVEATEEAAFLLTI